MICTYATATLFRLNKKINDAKVQQSELNAVVTAQEIENDRMRYAIEHKDDAAFKADFARTDLGLLGADDHVFYDSAY